MCLMTKGGKKSENGKGGGGCFGGCWHAGLWWSAILKEELQFCRKSSPQLNGLFRQISVMSWGPLTSFMSFLDFTSTRLGLWSVLPRDTPTKKP